MGRGCSRGYYTVTSHAGLGMLPSGDALAAIPRVDGRPPRGIGADRASDAPVSMVIGNLLPQANTTLTLPSEGVYVGDGLPPVPPKLATKIRRGDFVEMGKLLPEFWSSWKEEDGESRKGLKPQKNSNGDGHPHLGPVLQFVRSHPSPPGPRAHPRAHGIPGHNREGEPGLLGDGLGAL